MTNAKLMVLLTLTLEVACCPRGASPPVLPPPRVVMSPVPCLTQPPLKPDPEMTRRLSEGLITTTEENSWLWTQLEIRDRRIARDWATCGRR